VKIVCQFCRLIQKDAVVTLVISGVTGPIFINVAENVGMILPVNIFLIKTAIFQSVWNVSLPLQMKVIWPILLKIGFMATSLEESEKEI